MSILEFLVAVALGAVIGIPIGYVQFRIKQYRENRVRND